MQRENKETTKAIIRVDDGYLAYTASFPRRPSERQVVAVPSLGERCRQLHRALARGEASDEALRALVARSPRGFAG